MDDKMKKSDSLAEWLHDDPEDACTDDAVEEDASPDKNQSDNVFDAETAGSFDGSFGTSMMTVQGHHAKVMQVIKEASEQRAKDTAELVEQVKDVRSLVDGISEDFGQVPSVILKIMEGQQALSNSIQEECETRKNADVDLSKRLNEMDAKMDDVLAAISGLSATLSTLREELSVQDIQAESKAMMQEQEASMQEHIEFLQKQSSELSEEIQETLGKSLRDMASRTDAILSDADKRLGGISAKAKSEMDGITASYSTSAKQIERKINENTLDKFWTGGTIAGVVIVVFGIIATGILYGMMSHFDVSDDVSQIQSTTNRIIWNQYYPAVYPGAPNARMYSPFERGFNDAWNNQFQVEQNAAMQAEQQNQQSK